MAISNIPTCLRTCTLDSEYSTWVPTISLILVVVVFGLAIIFLVSRMLGRREWEAMVRAELYQTAVAVVWVVIIGAAATAACSSVCSITGDDSPFTTATNYINGIRANVEQISVSLLAKAKQVRLNTAYAFGFLGTFVTPYAGCDMIAENYETFAVMMSPIVGSMMVQQYALTFISAIAFSLLLPLGIVLKLIPFLREAGSFIIALAFALYIVFPLTYVFAEKATGGVSFSAINPDTPLNCIEPDAALRVFQSVGSALPQAIFFPALSSILTIAAARTLSKVFKYDFQEIL